MGRRAFALNGLANREVDSPPAERGEGEFCGLRALDEKRVNQMLPIDDSFQRTAT